MESVLSDYSLNNITLYCFTLGIMFNMMQDLIMSLINYLNNKAWRVNDYERILYKTYEDIKYDDKDIECMGQAIVNYKKYLNQKEKREKFLNKFRRK